MPDVTSPPARIGLIGGECTGKSTLARLLATALPACVVDESLRDFTERMGRPPQREEQAGLLAEQADREDAAAASCDRDVLVADPAVLMTAVYSLLYFEDDTLVSRAIAHAQGYALLVWCAPDLPWEPDPGQRDGAGHRDRADAIIADLVERELRPRGIPVLHVTGSAEARVTAVTRAWQPGASEAPT